MQADIENSRRQLDLKEVDYEATMAAKISIARRVYRLEKNQVFGSAAFKKYFEENKVSLFGLVLFLNVLPLSIVEYDIVVWNFSSLILIRISCYWQEWLRPYAAFCFLRDLFGTADHSQWGVYAKFTPEKVRFDQDHMT